MIPSTVDPSRFDQTGSRPFDNFYIGYFGSLTFKRDNVDILIKAFAQISQRHPHIKLVLGGFCPEPERKMILELIASLNITGEVEILEYLARQEIIRYIAHADVLVMTRAKDMESEASYPSKLTEFLATGKPVVSVNVGEVSDFLQDGVNAFLTEAGNVEALAGKLEYIINNYPQAACVGEKGKELTSGVFNYRYQSKRFVEYIDSLYN
jgi:glycosyltransferase involved in cell wall biosynthesis